MGSRIYLARLAALPVFDPNGDRVGRVRDAVVRLRTTNRPPQVVGLVAEMALRRRIFLPIGRVTSMDAESVVLGTGSLHPVATLTPGPALATPRIKLDRALDALTKGDRDRVADRLSRWLGALVALLRYFRECLFAPLCARSVDSIGAPSACCARSVRRCEHPRAHPLLASAPSPRLVSPDSHTHGRYLHRCRYR